MNITITKMKKKFSETQPGFISCFHSKRLCPHLAVKQKSKFYHFIKELV